jgi:hypothetical protein
MCAGCAGEGLVGSQKLIELSVLEYVGGIYRRAEVAVVCKSCTVSGCALTQDSQGPICISLVKVAGSFFAAGIKHKGAYR